MQYSLIVTGLVMIYRQGQNDLIIERTYLSTTHEVVNIVIMQQDYQFNFDVNIQLICDICKNTDFFVLPAYFFSESRPTTHCCKQPVVSGA